MGGPGGKTNSEELFAAAYAASFHGAVRRVAADRGVAFGKSIVEARAGLDLNGNGSGFTLVELHAQGAGRGDDRRL